MMVSRPHLVALFLALSLPLVPVTARAQPMGAQEAEARTRHQAGQRFLEGSPSDPNAALAEFSAAYNLMQGHPRRFLELENMGRCYQQLGQYDRALEFYQRFLAEGGSADQDGPRIQAAIVALTATLGGVGIGSNVPAEVWVDNRRVGDAPGWVRIPGGRHVIELRARGYSSSRQEVDVTSRQNTTAQFTLDRSSASLSPVLFWSGVGATVVAAGLGAVFGGRALAARSDVDARAASSDPNVRYSVGDADAERIAELSLVADVFFAGAAVLGIGTVVMYFLTDFGGRATGPSGAASVRLSPSLSQRGGSLGLQVNF